MDFGVEWYQDKKKSITELGHSDRLKVYVNPSKIYVNPSKIYVHSNYLFSETPLPMVLKFHMQHDGAAGLQNDKIQPGRDSKNAAVAKNN